MSRLKKIEIYAINWLNSQNRTPEDIANELGLKVDQVNKTLEKTHSATNGDGSVRTRSEPVGSKSKDLMITSTAGKKNKNVSIMTKEASEYNDAVRNKTDTNSRTSNSIFRTKPNE